MLSRPLLIRYSLCILALSGLFVSLLPVQAQQAFADPAFSRCGRGPMLP
jgi:hypothetical protein